MHRKKMAKAMLGILLILILTKGTAPGTGADDSWRRVADIPTPRSNHAAAVVDGQIYVLGGYGDGGMNVVLKYNPVTNQWRRVADMLIPRCDLAAAVVDGKIYVLGGENIVGGDKLSIVEEYDPATDTWTRRRDMPTPRNFLAAAAVGGRLYALGGWDVNGNSIAIVEEYDPATDTWTRRRDMLTPRNAFAAATVNGKIYAISNTVEVYDPPFYDTDRDGIADDDELRDGRDPLVPEWETTPPELSVPIVTVESPNGGESWQDLQTITWTATDHQADPLTYTVYYSPNGGQTWTRLATGLTESSYLWDTTTVVNGVNYLIRVEATDGTYIGVGLSNGPFKIANEAINTAPTVTETRSEAFFVPSFRVIEAIGALFVLLGLGKMQRRRKM